MIESKKYENWELMQAYANHYLDLVELFDSGEFNIAKAKAHLDAMKWCIDESNKK